MDRPTRTPADTPGCSVDPDTDLCIAAGVVGHFIAIELMILLMKKGVLDDEGFSDVLDRALVSVENLDPQLPPFQLARHLLWRHVAA